MSQLELLQEYAHSIHPMDSPEEKARKEKIHRYLQSMYQSLLKDNFFTVFPDEKLRLEVDDSDIISFQFTHESHSKETDTFFLQLVFTALTELQGKSRNVIRTCTECGDLFAFLGKRKKKYCRKDCMFKAASKAHLKRQKKKKK